LKGIKLPKTCQLKKISYPIFTSLLMFLLEQK